MFVGGEFFYDQCWLSDRPTLSTEKTHFLNGGRACLAVIGDYLVGHGINKILLPSYLCPSILDALDRSGLTYDYYQVNEDLSIDLDDLSKKATNFKAVYFINYFGFLHSPETRKYLKDLQKKGILVVEDNAQAGFTDHPIGDFVFNSLRKLVPYDGGYLVTDLDVAPHLSKYRGLPNRRLPLIREYRQRLHDYLVDGAGSYRKLVNLYSLADHYYEIDNVIEGDPGEQQNIERLDWEGIRRIRRENYRYMLEAIASIPEIKPVFPSLQPDAMPLGLPVYVNGVSRDEVYEYLGKKGIGLFIHWEELRHDLRTKGKALAISMSGRMLTLATDQRTSREQMDYLADHLVKGIKLAKKA
jgi:dTDP-4-amino-4,6-dideoxygalactose transaminase